MSTAGRIFVVLNLVFAAGFVFFAGTHLQGAADYKQQLASYKQEKEEEVSRLTAQLTAVTQDREDANRELSAAQTARDNYAAQVKEKEAVIARQAQEISGIQASLDTIKGAYSGIEASITRAVAEAEQASKRAIEAGQAQVAAERAKEVAEAEQLRLENELAQANSNITDNSAMIAQLRDTIREKDILLDVVRVKVPGLLEKAQPVMTGSVTQVDAGGKLVTIRITENRSGADVLPGYSFAIYNAETQTYKGEAIVQDVDGEFAFCRMSITVGPKVTAGDRAATNTFGS